MRTLAQTSRLAGTLACALLAALPGRAQNSQMPEEGEEVVTLPAFTVRSRDDGSYMATETTSGTRIAQKIIDLPYSVQVLTTEFFNDFNLYDLDDQVPFISNFAAGDKNSGGGGGTRIRGLTVPYFRNGFYRRQAPDSNSIARVEVVKGPASAIYGRTSPGGVINFISKKPQTKAQAGLRASIGTHDSERFSAYTTGPILDDTLFYRIDAAYYELHRPTDFWYNRTRNLSGGLTWKASDDTSWSFEFEHTNRVMNDYQNFTRWVDENGRTRGLVWEMEDRELAERLVAFNGAGANRRTERNNDSFYLTFEHRFNPQLNMRASVGHSEREYERVGPTSAGFWDVRSNQFPQGWRGFRHMDRKTILDEQTGAQVDFTYMFNTGDIQHRTLFTIDVFEDDTEDKDWRLRGNALAAVLDEILPEGTPRTAWTRPDPFEPEFLASLPDPQWDPANPWPLQDSGTFNLFRSYYGGLVSHSMSMMDHRWIVTGSVRGDSADIQRQQPLSSDPELQDARTDLTEYTYSIGTNYHIIPEKFVAFVSHNTSFDPSPQVDRNTGEILGNKTAKGAELGLKGAFFEETLSYTVSVFDIRQDNEVVANPDNPGGADPELPALIPGGSSKTQGLGIDVTGRLTKNLTVIGNVGWTDARIVANENSPELVGRRLTGGQGGPGRSAAVALRYSFRTGALKNLNAGLTYQYYPSYIRFYGNANADDVYLPGKSEWGAMLSYWHKLGDKSTVSYSLNVSNLLDVQEITTAMFAPPGREINFTTSLKF